MGELLPLLFLLVLIVIAFSVIFSFIPLRLWIAALAAGGSGRYYYSYRDASAQGCPGKGRRAFDQSHESGFGIKCK